MAEVINIENIEIADTAYPGVLSFKAGDQSQKSDYAPKQCLDISNFENAGKSIQLINNAVDLVSEMRSYLGAVQNRLEHTIDNLGVEAENLSASESLLRDTDIADEMVEWSKNDILRQAGQSMLAQANQSTQGVLGLLG